MPALVWCASKILGLRKHRSLDEAGGGTYRTAALTAALGRVCRLPWPSLMVSQDRRAANITILERIDMANTPSAKKATRKIARRTAVNKVPRTRMRSFIRRVEEAIASGDKDAAVAALRDAQPQIMKAASKGIVHKNTASRKVSRLSHRVQALG